MDFTVGMKVVIHSGWSDESIGEVTEITKGGNIRVGNTIYNKHGRLRGSDSWSRNYIYPATEEDIEKITREEKIEKCKSKMRTQINREPMNYELAVKLLRVFEEWEGGNGEENSKSV